MIISRDENPIKIEAEEGYILTNGETYSHLVYLGIHDSPENWHEIPESEVPEEDPYADAQNE